MFSGRRHVLLENREIAIKNVDRRMGRHGIITLKNRNYCMGKHNFKDISVESVSYSPLTLSLPEASVKSIIVFLTFSSVDETLVCDHSNGSY